MKVWSFCILTLLSLIIGISVLVMTKTLMPMMSDSILVEMEISLTNFMFFSLVSLISILVINWAGSYMSSSFKLSLFYISLMTFILSMLVLTLSQSLFLVFIGWEGLGVSSFLLIMLYQNWMSAKGALLTLLTNRVGDAILMITFCYWLSMLVKKVEMSNTVFFLILLFFVSITKSAQWPYVNWLPAAMAAPTPVSALVHSSTLVTAGVWILIRFSSSSLLFYSVWLMLGLVTLTIASTSALSEKDGKKVVALSTLSQLGMMFISLSLGNQFICLFHVLTHALAKANLFMVVGELLHKSFSQQDTRQMLLMALSKPLMMSMSISVLSLMGFVFTSGFFSKEQILLGQYFYLTSTLSWVILIIVSSLTLSYCIKLMMVLSMTNLTSSTYNKMSSSLSSFSILFMSMTVIFMGWAFSLNLSAYSLMMISLQGWYWLLIILGLVILFLSLQSEVFMGMGFWSQGKSLDLMFIETLLKTKVATSNMESSLLEMFYLVISLHLNSVVKNSARVIFILVCLMVVLSFF